MLEHYYSRLPSLDAKRALWIGTGLDVYAGWLAARETSKARGKDLLRKVVSFAKYAEKRGVRTLEGLPGLVDGFVQLEMRRLRAAYQKENVARSIAATARSSTEQFLALNLPGYKRPDRRSAWPLLDRAPGFLGYLRDERGLRNATLDRYKCHIGFFERYLENHRIADFQSLTPKNIQDFLEWSTKKCAAGGRICRAGCLRIFLRYLHRQRLITEDLGRAIPRGRAYKSAGIPRAIPWSEVQRVLESVDRRSAVGKRNYAMLQLLATYGLRAQDVARLETKSIDWNAATFRVRSRKAGNSTTYPLAAHVGEAIIDYLRKGRPTSQLPQLFISAVAPYRPIDFVCASLVAKNAFRRAGVKGHRLGSHTLRHSCAQHLVNSNVSFKHIGDFLGHKSASTTLVYAKVAVHKLRALTSGTAEEAL